LQPIWLGIIHRMKARYIFKNIKTILIFLVNSKGRSSVATAKA
jgi:hypothetical protein